MVESIDVYLSFMGEDFTATVEYRVTYWGAPATGPSFYSAGEPAEGPEWDIESIHLRWDHPDSYGAEFEATGALFHHLAWLDRISDKIADRIASEGCPEPDYEYWREM